MLWFWFTLVAEASPLICASTSFAVLESCHAAEPGCRFSETIGLLAATATAAGRGTEAITARSTAAPSSRVSRRSSVRTVQCQNDPEGAGDQLQVQPKAPGVDVLKVERQRLVEIQLGATADLPEPGESRLDSQATGDRHAAGGELVGQARPWADQAHVAQNDVHELRELVEAGCPKD